MRTSANGESAQQRRRVYAALKKETIGSADRWRAWPCCHSEPSRSRSAPCVICALG
jgi:hypothetical protein